MREHSGRITVNGGPVTLMGDVPDIGAAAPEFSLRANDLTRVRLGDSAGRVRILASVASLDTDVCDAETRRFNQEATDLGADVVVLTISMDLPFAQARWCGAAGIDRVQTLSDHYDASFGKDYGVLIKEHRLLARAVFVVDPGGIVTYRQLVKEVSDEPEYGPVIAAVKDLL